MACNHHQTCRTFCACKRCKKKRFFIKIDWYLNNIKKGLKTIFQSTYKREIKSIRVSEINCYLTFDINDQNSDKKGTQFEWGLLKKSILKKGLDHPIILMKIRDIENSSAILDLPFLQLLADKVYYIPLDGRHRLATIKHIKHSDPFAIIDAVVIDEEELPYYTAFFTPTLWDPGSDYGAMLKELENIKI